MDVKELRIGNYVNFNNGSPDEVDDFQWGSEDYEYYETVMFNILPIPLTEEWLVKFGFDNLGAYGWGIGYFHIRFRNIHKFYFPLKNRLVRIKHVHKLQNLYFALTNEELTILN